MKRAFDILFSAALLLLLAPVLLICAIGVRLSSPGPVLYAAQRVGQGGVPFAMYKFRTMGVNTGGSVITGARDVRIFPFGGLLRKFKLDELPQFFNVIRGDMAIVGPRPEDPKIVRDHYADWMKETLDVRPGITSPGAVFYYACGEKLVDDADPEQSYVDRLLPTKLAVERGYLERATFLSDLRVIWRTAWAVLGEMRGKPVQPDAADIQAATTWVPATAFDGVQGA